MPCCDSGTEDSCKHRFARAVVDRMGKSFILCDFRSAALILLQGNKYPPERVQQLRDAAALKHETYLQDCVDAYVMLAQNTSMTGMRVQVDAGLNVQGA